MLLDPVPALKGGFEMPKPVRRCRSVPSCGGTAVMDGGGAPLLPPIGLGISIEMWLGRRPQRPVACLGLVGEERAVIFLFYCFFQSSSSFLFRKNGHLTSMNPCYAACTGNAPQDRRSPSGVPPTQGAVRRRPRGRGRRVCGGKFLHFLVKYKKYL